jgi:hypothetical protein
LYIGSLSSSIIAANAYNVIVPWKCGCLLISCPAKFKYSTDVRQEIGIPRTMGKKERFSLRIAASASSRDLARRSAFRTPSRLRKRIVLRMSSNWIAAAPNADGDARRTKAWFNMDVNSRENSWRPMREDIEDHKPWLNPFLDDMDLHRSDKAVYVIQKISINLSSRTVY